MYNRNKYRYYTRRCIITIFISYYIRRYIITTNISLIHKSVYCIIHHLVY